MSVKLLTFADGAIRLGGEEPPGILSSLRIDGQVRYDEQKVDGASGESKTPQGWEDQTLTAALILTTDEAGDCYEKLARLNALFRGTDGKANPQVYALANRQAGARGVRQVVFDRLESAESNSDDVIRVTLGFSEHNPPIVRVEEAAAKTPAPGEAAEQDTPKPEQEPSLDVEAG